MSLSVKLVGTKGYTAKVTALGELIVSPVSPNESQHWKMEVINQAYSFAPPVAGKKMLLQNILMYGNKNIGTGDAAVVIFTASSETATTGTTVLELELPKYATRDLIGLHLELPEGVYLNAKTDDNDVFLTMMGYYVNV